MKFSQKIKRGVFLLLFSSSTFLELNVLCQDNLDNITSPSISSELSKDTHVDITAEIVLDGIHNEKAWLLIPFQSLENDGREIKYKLYSNNAYLYLLVVFPSEKEKRQHRLWHWDPLKQLYLSGPEKEDELYVIWSEFPQHALPDSFAKNADVWIWRAARTDPSGFADDCYLINDSLAPIPENGKVSLWQDNGKSCWFNRYFAAFAGSELPRYDQRSPEGSLSDVKAKGIWNSGIWTIEFSRKINTGNPDDINFARAPGLSVSFSDSPPEDESLKFSKFKRTPEFTCAAPGASKLEANVK